MIDPERMADTWVSKAVEVCLYCDGGGSGSAGPCGFCENGKPLDTQEDWDNTWGWIFRPRADGSVSL